MASDFKHANGYDIGQWKYISIIADISTGQSCQRD